MLGTLVFYHNQVRPYNREDQQFCRALADLAAVAVENALLHQETQRRLRELTALHEVDLQITSALDVGKVLETIAEQLRQVLGVATLYIGLYDAERDVLRLPLIIDRGERRPQIEQIASDSAGLAGWVVRSGQPLWVDDMLEEQFRLPVEAVRLGEATRSLAVLPLVVKGVVVGVLSVQSYEPHAFDAGDRRLLDGIAAQAAIAIENARLYQEVTRRLAQTRVLREVMLAAASTLDFDQVLERACETLQTLLRVEYLGVVLPEEGKWLRSHPSMIGYSAPADQIRVPMKKSICGRVLQTGEPMIVGDVREVPYYHAGVPEVRSELAVPVRVGDQVIGVLNVESSRFNAFDADDLALYSAIAGQLGVALENAHLYQREQQQRREAETLYRAAQALTTTLELREVLDRILSELQQVVPYDSATVQFLYDNQLQIIGGRGFPNLEELLGFTFDLSGEGNPNGEVMRTRAPVILEDAPPVYEEFSREPHAAAAIRAWMGIPLLFGDRSIGMLALDKREPGFYTPEHARLALAFASQAAIAVENARLYRQLEEKSAELDRALRELQDLERLRNEVVQNVSHELRTPLTLIQGYTELLLAGDLGPIVETHKRALEVIRERAATLSQLIYNLTALGKIPHDTLVLHPIRIQEPVRRALRNYRLVAQQAGVRLEVEMPEDLPRILGDGEYLRLVFSHLIDNAIKFSPGGGLVCVQAWASEQWVHVAIQDQGIGIAPEHLEHIFERFYQVDGSTTRRFGGMGIGLSLVWEIVEAHRGRVTVKSEPGEGSTFTVTLPQAQE